MKIVRGNLWDSKDDVILVTCNSYIKQDGAVVMGRGAALELKKKLAGIDLVFGRRISRICGSLGGYGVIHTAIDYPSLDRIYGLFQVKYHFKDNAQLSLIDFSTFELIKMTDGLLFSHSISMNFPGIGFGHLKYNDVLAIVNRLPDNISLYIRE